MQSDRPKNWYDGVLDVFDRGKPETVEGTEGKVHWYHLSSEEALERNRSRPDGLSPDEVDERIREFGPNELPSRKPPTVLQVFLRQFLSPLIYVLLAAAVISLLLEDVEDAIFISAVLLINALIGTYQEMKAERSAEGLQKLLRTTARVRREGTEFVVPAEDLVPGDIVLLESGVRVPADLRLLVAKSLNVDESLLTGESLAVQKVEQVLDDDLSVSERRNMAFAGSTVSSGRGVGLVVATAQRTEIGQIAKAVSMVDDSKPPLVIRLERFSKQISYIILLAGVGMGAMALLRGIPLEEVFFLVVALAVSAIPEGLPVAVTVAMAVRVTRMAKRNVLTRRLAAVESLGSCTCIASDKTGTMTVNRQTARAISLGPDTRLAITGDGYSGEGEITMDGGASLSPGVKDHLERLVQAAVISNEGTLESKEGTWSYSGDAVDVALLALGYKAGLDVSGVRLALVKRGEVPYESERRYQAMFYEVEGKVMAAVKGAIEVVLPFCSDMSCVGECRPVSPALVDGEASYLTNSGYRVLAVAVGEVGGDGPFDETALHGLTFLGIIGLIDPPRPEVKIAVAKCKRAGIEVVMVTGDHPATALAIAQELGIATGPEEVVTGKELSEIGDPDVPLFLEKVRQGRVFARVTPIQKLEIVDALIRLGNFVAVTGDGVNDAPALRKANIGVAMGSGTDVAKDASSIIITDDNFASIVAGVEEGRYAYENVRKVTWLLVSTGMAEITLFVLALLFGAIDPETGALVIPLMAVQLLWLNVVTEGIQHVTLAMEPGDPEVMDRPPRDPKEGIFDKTMVRQVVLASLVMGILAFLVYYYLVDQLHYSAFAASNMVLLLMVLLENVHVFNCRSERKSVFQIPLRSNYYLILGVLGAQGIHILAMYTPLLQDVLMVEPVSFLQWASMLLVSITLLVAVELYKLWLRAKDRDLKKAAPVEDVATA